MNYGEALEQQVGALRTLSHPDARAALAAAWPRAAGPLLGWDGLVWSLARSEPVYVGPDVCALLGGVAAQGGPAWRLAEEELLTARGFCWFAANPGYVDPSDPRAELVALSWAPRWMSHVRRQGAFQTVVSVGDPPPDAVRSFRALWLHPWYHPKHLPVRRASLPWAPLYAAFGTDLAACAATPPTHASDGEPLGAVERHDLAFLTALFAALMLFVRQRLLTAEREVAERHSRRRVLEQGWTPAPLIRVVQLRRRASPTAPSGDGTPASVDWSCRWLVRGHWRQQACGPGRSERRPVWITPYVKGPTARPLKAPGLDVFAVVR